MQTWMSEWWHTFSFLDALAIHKRAFILTNLLLLKCKMSYFKGRLTFFRQFFMLEKANILIMISDTFHLPWQTWNRQVTIACPHEKWIFPRCLIIFAPLTFADSSEEKGQKYLLRGGHCIFARPFGNPREVMLTKIMYIELFHCVHQHFIANYSRLSKLATLEHP